MDTSNYLKFASVLLSLILLSACFHEDDPETYLKVFKYDGSIQCESAGIPLVTMALQLTNAGIDIICSQKGHDGLGRIASCGIDTGNINIYTIHSANQVDAEIIGFSPVSVLNEYQDEACN